MQIEPRQQAHYHPHHQHQQPEEPEEDIITEGSLISNYLGKKVLAELFGEEYDEDERPPEPVEEIPSEVSDVGKAIGVYGFEEYLATEGGDESSSVSACG